MLKIYPRLNSVIGATLDRMDVRRYASRGVKTSENVFYSRLTAESGDSSNNPKTIVKNWKRAYDANLKKNLMIADLNKKICISTSDILDKILR